MKKETILLVDDDEPMLSMLAKSLEERYRVLVATSGMTAVYVYEQHGEAIVALVTDVEMPRLNGTALAEWVRHINPAAHHSYEWLRAGERISQLQQRPGIAFMAKPFMPTKGSESAFL